MSTAGLNPAASAASSAPIERSEGVWHAAWRRFKADRVGLVSAIIVLAFLLLVLLASLGLVAKNWQAEVGVANAPPTFIGPKPAEATGAIEVPKGPNVDLSAVDPLAPRYAEIEEAAKKYRTTDSVKAETLPLGGDRLGRDVLDKAVKGTQISVFVGVLAAVLATLIGTVLGALAGFFGGKVGDFLEWLYNVFEAIPSILLIFAFAAVFGRGIGTVVLILGLAGWTGLYRQVRAEFMKHGGREYVRAAEAIGASAWSRMFKHILPNTLAPVIVQATFLCASAMIAEATLSFIGAGTPPIIPSWGNIMAEGRALWQVKPYIVFFPAVFLSITVLSVNLLGDGLRDALDPRMAKRI